MKKVLNKILIIMFISFIVASNVLGLWFLMGGDLSDLTNECYNANGCEGDD